MGGSGAAVGSSGEEEGWKRDVVTDQVGVARRVSRSAGERAVGCLGGGGADERGRVVRGGWWVRGRVVVVGRRRLRRRRRGEKGLRRSLETIWVCAGVCLLLRRGKIVLFIDF